MTRPCVAAPTPTAPAIEPPAHACDTHTHVLGPFDRYPLAATRPYTPPPATVDDLIAMLDRMGVERVVVAHVSAHGFDLSVTLDAMKRLGDRARGVALVPVDVSDARLDELDAAGMRGMRLSHAYGQGMGIDDASLLAWSERIAARGWHVAMWPTAADEFRSLERVVARADRDAAPLVIDHLGHRCWLADGRVDANGLALLCDLLASGRVWLKLSAPYRVDPSGAPWDALRTAVERLVATRTDRLLWATDWPHVGLWSDDEMPASGALLDWLDDVLAGDRELRHRILVDNPVTLYGFPP